MKSVGKFILESRQSTPQSEFRSIFDHVCLWHFIITSRANVFVFTKLTRFLFVFCKKSRVKSGLKVNLFVIWGVGGFDAFVMILLKSYVEAT